MYTNYMKKILIVMMLLFISPNSAYAVENGYDGSNDPNAVSINNGGFSGFLYSPRIVFSVAHVQEFVRSGQIKNFYVSYPGKDSNSTTIKVQEIIWPSNFVDRNNLDFSRKNDFVIFILEKPMPMTNKVIVASKQQVEEFKKYNREATLVGYGYQSNLMRQSRSISIKPHITKNIMLDDLSALQILNRALPPKSNGSYEQVGYKYDINFLQKEGQSSICDGDSGAGWFVEENNIRYYLGAQSNAWGIPNCGRNGRWDINGSLASSSNGYDNFDLIKRAEEYIKKDETKKKVIVKTIKPKKLIKK